MGVRGPSDKDALKLVNERFDKLLGRIYLLWLIGIGIGLIKLRADRVFLGGVQYNIANPEAIQGLMFIAVMICYSVILFLAFSFSLQYATFGNRTVLRRMIYLAMGSKKTLSRPKNQIRNIKTIARQLFTASMLSMTVILFFPIIHIWAFERSALWLAFDAMFN